MPEQQAQIPQSLTRAAIQPSTYNDDERSVELEFGSETPYRRYGYIDGKWQYYNEVLGFGTKEIRWDRMNNGAPLLDQHDGYGSVLRQLGVVMSHKVEEKKGLCKVRFANTDEGIKAYQMVKDGIIQNISVGYLVHSYTVVNKGSDKEIPTLRATDWEPMEVSLVKIPADPTVNVRSGERPNGQLFNVSIKQNQAMPETANPIGTTVEPQKGQTEPVGGTRSQEQTPPAAPPAQQADPAAAAAAARQAVADERQRANQINTIVRTLGLPTELAEKHIGDGTDLNQFRQLAIEEAAKQANPSVRNHTPANQFGQFTTGNDGDTRFRNAAEASLIIRSGAFNQSQLKNLGFDDQAIRDARDFQSYTPVELARYTLERAGEHSGFNREDILQRALGGRRSITSNSSDFPVLLEGTARRVLQAGFQAEPFDWNQWCTTGSVGDFRKYERVNMHESFNRLAKVEENGEYETFAINDGEKESVQVFTYGKKFNLTRKMLINDDLNAFIRLMAMFGRACQRSIQIDAYSVLLSNSGLGPTMGDGNPLFHVSHGNISTDPGAFSIDRWDKMRIQMATQKPYGGKVEDYLNVRPSLLLCDITLGTAAKLLNGETNDPFASSRDFKRNPVARLFNSILDTPWLGGSPKYYAFADPNQLPTFEVTFLNGVQEPRMSSQESWDTDGIEYKASMDYGIGAVGYKGALYNAGV